MALNEVTPVSGLAGNDLAHIGRDKIKNGFFQEMAREAEARGLIKLSTEAEREASWRAILQSNPNSDGKVWIFAYGSLLWNPAFHLVDRVDAYLDGYHRDFCLRTYIGRGNFEQPGLVLGLESGGCCHGQALQMDPTCVEEEMSVLWSREMIANAYIPQWHRLKTPDHEALYAVAFVMDQNYRHYAGSMGFEERCYDLAHGTGPLGCAADYLFETVTALENIDLTDDLLERYVTRVKALREA